MARDVPGDRILHDPRLGVPGPFDGQLVGPGLCRHPRVRRSTLPGPALRGHKNKTRRKAGLSKAGEAELLELRFLVHHVLAADGIELLDLHLFRHGLLFLEVV